MAKFVRVFGSIEVAEGKEVASIDLNLVARDIEGEVHVTDVMLQDGKSTTGYLINTKEVLKRDRDAGGGVVRRHYNVVIRGTRQIAVPNRAIVEEETGLRKRVTGAMDFTFTATAPVPPGGLEFSHQYKTRRFRLWDPLAAGDKFEFLASKGKVATNGRPTGNYVGFFHTCPAGMGRFNVTAPAGILLCEPDTWMLAKGGERL